MKKILTKLTGLFALSAMHMLCASCSSLNSPVELVGDTYDKKLKLSPELIEPRVRSIKKNLSNLNQGAGTTLVYTGSMTKMRQVGAYYRQDVKASGNYMVKVNYQFIPTVTHYLNGRSFFPGSLFYTLGDWKIDGLDLDPTEADQVDVGDIPLFPLTNFHVTYRYKTTVGFPKSKTWQSSIDNRRFPGIPCTVSGDTWKIVRQDKSSNFSGQETVTVSTYWLNDSVPGRICRAEFQNKIDGVTVASAVAQLAQINR